MWLIRILHVICTHFTCSLIVLNACYNGFFLRVLHAVYMHLARGFYVFCKHLHAVFSYFYARFLTVLRAGFTHFTYESYFCTCFTHNFYVFYTHFVSLYVVCTRFTCGWRNIPPPCNLILFVCTSTRKNSIIPNKKLFHKRYGKESHIYTMPLSRKIILFIY